MARRRFSTPPSAPLKCGLLALLVGAALLVGCSQPSSQPPAPVPVPAPTAPTDTGSPQGLAPGELPRLIRLRPEGQEHLVTELDGVPDMLFYMPETMRVRFQDSRRPHSYQIDLVTGKAIPDGSLIVGAHGFGEIIFTSLDRQKTAEVLEPSAEGASSLATLLLSEAGKQVDRLENWLPFQADPPGSRVHKPSGAWNPEGTRMAITGWPEIDIVELLIFDPSTRTANRLAEQQATGRPVRVTWSPDGRFITFGPLLLEAATGRVVNDQADGDVYWSPDGRHFITSLPHTSQDAAVTRWGRLALVEAATGAVRDIGPGWALGWTPEGEALFARWENPHPPL